MIHGSFTGEWGFWHQAPRSPEAIGITILSALAIESTVVIGSLTTAAIVGQVALTAASVALSYGAQALFAGKQDQSVNPRENASNIRQAIVSRRRSYGEVKIGGVTAFYEKGDINAVINGGTAINDLNIVLLQGQGEIDSVLEHWMGDQQVLLDPVTGIVNGPIPGTEYINTAWIKNKLGIWDQTAHEDLVDSFEPDFSVNHRWRGVPNTFFNIKAPVDAESAQKVWPYGPVPYRSVQHAAKVHDPRIDTQNPDGNPDDPTDALTGGTGWTYSDNAALVILDFIRHPDGFAVKADREMVPISQFHLPDWIVFADLCDEEVERKDGSGPMARYRIWGTYDLTSAPKSILDGMLAACDGEIYRTGSGKIGIRGGKWDDPTLTIEGDDLLSHSMKKGNRQYASCNRVNAKYISRQHDYQQVDMDSWIDQDNIDLRRLELTIDLDFAWVSHHSQARRLSKIQINKRNPAWTGTIITGPRGLLAFNERTINVTILELAISRSFLITSFRPAANFSTVEIGIASLDSSAYEWDEQVEEGDALTISAVSLEDTILPQPENVEFNSATTGTPGELLGTLSWENNSGITLFGQVEYQDATISGFLAFETEGFGSTTWIDILVPEDFLETSVLLDESSNYAFRARFVSPAGKASKWVDPIPVGGGFILREDDTELQREDDGFFIREAA